MSDTVRILHFGDLHVWKKAFPPGEWWYPKRWLGAVNLLALRARRFPEAYRQPLIDRVMVADADVVIFTGDFTTLSQPSEFEESARLFAPIAEK
jgi:3',5'-cyclic AMP phosphodiesterase CpdA